jgi:uncharacterized protein YuzE
MKETLQYCFDKEADILYISQGPPRAEADSEEVEDGIVARFDPSTHAVIGFTILNFLKRADQHFPTTALPFKAELSLFS